jgi:hypothetical protein
MSTRDILRLTNIVPKGPEDNSSFDIVDKVNNTIKTMTYHQIHTCHTFDVWNAARGSPDPNAKWPAGVELVASAYNTDPATMGHGAWCDYVGNTIIPSTDRLPPFERIFGPPPSTARTLFGTGNLHPTNQPNPNVVDYMLICQDQNRYDEIARMVRERATDAVRIKERRDRQKARRLDLKHRKKQQQHELRMAAQRVTTSSPSSTLGDFGIDFLMQSSSADAGTSATTSAEEATEATEMVQA